MYGYLYSNMIIHNILYFWFRSATLYFRNDNNFVIHNIGDYIYIYIYIYLFNYYYYYKWGGPFHTYYVCIPVLFYYYYNILLETRRSRVSTNMAAAHQRDVICYRTGSERTYTVSAPPPRAVPIHDQ